MKAANEVLAALQNVVEEGEQRDWAAYALGRPEGRGAPAVRPTISSLLEEAELPDLRRRRELLAIDADARVLEMAARAEEREERADDPADVLVELFARKELLARRAGHAGYAELALAADGVSLSEVTTELAVAEQTARDEIGIHMGAVPEALPDEKQVSDRFRAFFAPLLDAVEILFEPRAAVVGMSCVLHWPDRIGVVVRPARPAASPAERVGSLGITAHELGHVLQWRARADRGLGFLDFFSLPALASETAADIGERLLFEPELGGGFSLPRSLWSRERASTMLQQIGRARFELEVYAAALDAPGTLPALWAETTRGRVIGGWSRDGHGFYTEDPMRRYTYPVAYLRSKARLAELARPLTKDTITRVL